MGRHGYRTALQFELTLRATPLFWCGWGKEEETTCPRLRAMWRQCFEDCLKVGGTEGGEGSVGMKERQTEDRETER